MDSSDHSVAEGRFKMAIPRSYSCSNQSVKSIFRSVSFGGSKHLVVRSFREVDCGSDRCLLNAKVKHRLAESKQEAQKFHVYRLNRKKLSKLENRKYNENLQ